MESERINIYNLSLQELRDHIIENSFPPFKAKIAFNFMYKKFVSEFSQMSNLGKNLIDFFHSSFNLGELKLIKAIEGNDRSVKFLFRTKEGYPVESVLMEERDKVTVCLSSQSGCPVGCRFCATGKMGFFKNLSSGEIIEQAVVAGRYAREKFNKKINNIVFMGMGEPLLNEKNVLKSLEILSCEEGFQISPRKITVSTVGYTERLKNFAQKTRVNIAVSLHAPDAERRNELIPSLKGKESLEELLNCLKELSEKRKRLITIEYLLIKNFNDSPEDAKKLSNILNFRCKVNLISLNEIEGIHYSSPSPESVKNFQRELLKRKILTTIRKSKGVAIGAGCGQLGSSFLATLKGSQELL